MTCAMVIFPIYHLFSECAMHMYVQMYTYCAAMFEDSARRTIVPTLCRFPSEI
jgi:hypothetical protein